MVTLCNVAIDSLPIIDTYSGENLQSALSTSESDTYRYMDFFHCCYLCYQSAFSDPMLTNQDIFCSFGHAF